MWYLILSKPQGTLDVVMSEATAHLAWQGEQHRLGNVLFSGPTPDRSMGIYVIRAESLDAAKAIADTDPFHAKGLRAYDIYQWEVHQALGIGPFTVGGIRALAAESTDEAYTEIDELK